MNILPGQFTELEARVGAQETAIGNLKTHVTRLETLLIETLDPVIAARIRPKPASAAESVLVGRSTAEAKHVVSVVKESAQNLERVLGRMAGKDKE